MSTTKRSFRKVPTTPRVEDSPEENDLDELMKEATMLATKKPIPKKDIGVKEGKKKGKYTAKDVFLCTPTERLLMKEYEYTYDDIMALREQAAKMILKSEQDSSASEATSNEDDSISEGSEESEVSEQDLTNLSTWVPKFDREHPFSMLVVSSRNGGKSYFLKYLCVNVFPRTYNIVIIVNNSPDEKKQLSNLFVNQKNDNGVPTVVKTYDTFPVGLFNKLKENYEERIEKELPPLEILVLFDDQSTSEKNNDDVVSIYTRGRHINISACFLVQSLTLVSTLVRGNSDLCCITKLKSPELREKIIKNSLSGSIELPTDTKASEENKFYRDLLAQYCKNQGDFLIRDYREPSQRGNQEKEQELFQFRAPPMEEWEKFKLDDEVEDDSGVPEE